MELINSNWKEKGIKSLKQTFQFIESYKYSSYNDFINKSGHGIINFDLAKEIFENLENYKQFFQESLKVNNGRFLTNVILD